MGGGEKGCRVLLEETLGNGHPGVRPLFRKVEEETLKGEN